MMTSLQPAQYPSSLSQTYVQNTERGYVVTLARGIYDLRTHPKLPKGKVKNEKIAYQATSPCRIKLSTLKNESHLDLSESQSFNKPPLLPLPLHELVHT